MHYQLELSGETATLYIAGVLLHESIQTLLNVCAALPSHVRTLRLDLRALGAMSADATSAVRLILRQWRDSRRGELRLSTAHLVATFSVAQRPRAVETRSSSDTGPNELLRAAYL
jgi:hypothetical protein